LGRARLLILPSRREGLPAAALEALSTGRPVVSTAVGGLEALLGRDCGITVSPDDPGAFATAILEALDREWDPDVLSARAATFDVVNAVDSYLELYRSVLPERGCAS
jgi:glycosyltransferase involved in cell wall biosynthesis